MSFNRYLYVNDNPYKYVDPDGEFLNFVAKFVLDVAVNVAVNYLTTGELQVGSALKESATGVLNPAKTAAGIGKLAMAASKARSASRSVKKYEVGRANDLRARSQPGDGLDVHHVGQAKPMEQVVPGYDRSTAPAITLPRSEHAAIPTSRGSYSGSARDQLARDARALRNHTNAPNSAIKKTIDLNKEMYPGALKK
jgi:hypothetical protein